MTSLLKHGNKQRLHTLYRRTKTQQRWNYIFIENVDPIVNKRRATSDILRNA